MTWGGCGDYQRNIGNCTIPPNLFNKSVLFGISLVERFGLSTGRHGKGWLVELYYIM